MCESLAFAVNFAFLLNNFCWFEQVKWGSTLVSKIQAVFRYLAELFYGRQDCRVGLVGLGIPNGDAGKSNKGSHFRTLHWG
jgi:hypothetical protein